MNGLEPLIPISLFVSIAAVIILRGPLGKALAERMAGRTPAGESEEVASLRGELVDVHQRLEEMEQRGRESEPGSA